MELQEDILLFHFHVLEFVVIMTTEFGKQMHEDTLILLLNRDWYVAGLSGRKDVLILIDTSGNLHLSHSHS